VLKQLHLWDKTIENKICLIPHPNYIGCYDQCQYNYTRKSLGIGEDTIVLLHLGGIAKYKNNDLILDAAQAMQGKDIRFIIAGPAPENEYTRNIKQRIEKLSNVISLYGFVPDDEIAGLIQCSDALLVPHDIKSSLNSGTVFMSFSYGRTVICPEIGTIKDLKESDLCFSYRYKNKNENKEKLIETIELFYKKFYRNRDDLNKLNEKVLKYVEKNHAPKLLGEQYKNVIMK
jgi:glycosyltransferase involved in cell wall biosynthesis